MSDLVARARPTALALAIVVAALGCEPARPPVVDRPATRPTPAAADRATASPRVIGDGDALRSLDLTFGTTGPLPASAGSTLDARAQRYRAFVRDRLGQDEFVKALMQLLFPSVFMDRYLPLLPLTLKQAREGEATFYYLDRPCPPSQRVAVRAWWDPDRPVSICRDSYHPELRTDDRFAVPFYCEYSWKESFESRPRICRCGEKLLNCARDQAQQDALTSAVIDEPILTAAHVLRARRPFGDLLTMKDTVRSGLAEFVYHRNEYYRSGRFEPIDPAAAPALRPRDASYGGGILTSPNTLYLHDSQRVMGSRLWADFLCMPLVSTNVHAEQMFKMKQTNVRYGGHAELAAMDGCNSCHARLENVLEIYRPVPSAKFGLRFVLSHRPGTATFFGRGASDVRGTGPATFAWLGEMLTTQPEFVSCVVARVEELAYRGVPVPPELTGALEDRFRSGGDLIGIVEDAIVARYLTYSALAPSR